VHSDVAAVLSVTAQEYKRFVGNSKFWCLISKFLLGHLTI